MLSAFWADLRADLADSDPSRAARLEHAYQEAKARLDRAVPVDCGWGHCVNEVDPVDGKVIGGIGSPFCPCDRLPGWHCAYPAGQPRPAAPIKVAGRNGSRIQRSRRRHALPVLGNGYRWLPPRG